MKRVIIESPYAGDVARNLRYVRACMRDALMRGEAPFASHALYTQPGVLRDDVPEERELGIRAGFAWRAGADTVVYEDLGTSRGMELGIESARLQRGLIEWRALGDDWDTGAPDDEGKRPSELVSALAFLAAREGIRYRPQEIFRRARAKGWQP